jgi:hypothetical protein
MVEIAAETATKPDKSIAARTRAVVRAERRAEALSLRRSGCTFAAIGAALGISEAAAHKLVKRALRATVQTPADALREQELVELESLRAKLLGVLNAAHPLVSGGAIIHDVVRDGQGNVVIDPRTNEPLRMPLHNSKPVLEAIRLLLAVAESRRALLGADAPKRLSLMDSAGDPMKVVAKMDQERLERALAIGLARLRPQAETIDVVPTERDGSAER